ncbi:DUF1080 domain-containing protein [Marivirga sp. S37H4]|uniref:DUF1080 domain-containing protein n=1 Tax=Marivirga aurantiaca TaxID=2802615 RepID=A0A934WXV2_9BACT|nr:DUF1080 domain-containing protein [Marivirga aurantiaca]MBK6265163.1 DUF1080 domain-containing protein [Marivirga aurantiaca]
MKNLLFITLTLAVLSSCQDKEEKVWTYLLDPELSQWDQYLSYKHQLGYKGEQPKDKKGNLIEPIGLNPDGYDVFTIVKEEEEPVLEVSGEIYGCVISKEEYANYHLQLKVKWGDKKWVPREKLLKDSGILYHSVGPMGAEYWRSWMLSQEFQIMEGHMGDYWSQANSAIDIRAYIPEYIMNPVADVSQNFIPVGEGEEIAGLVLRSANYEKPEGEWNTLDLICFEDKSIHIVNGEVVMVLQNSRYVEDGKAIPLTKGKIQLQSEAAEVYYKDIKIRELTSLPNEYTSLF